MFIFWSSSVAHRGDARGCKRRAAKFPPPQRIILTTIRPKRRHRRARPACEAFINDIFQARPFRPCASRVDDLKKMKLGGFKLKPNRVLVSSTGSPARTVLTSSGSAESSSICGINFCPWGNHSGLTPAGLGGARHICAQMFDIRFPHELDERRRD